MALAGAALIRRRLRERFSITAPRVAVRPHLPWPWRIGGLLVAFIVGVAGGAWGYAWHSTPRTPAVALASDLQAWQARVTELEAEVATLRQSSGTAESSLNIERGAQVQLAQQLRNAERENAGLKEDLAFFEGLVPGAGGAEGGPTRITRLKVERDGATNQYRFRMLIAVQTGRGQAPFKGTLEMSVQTRQGDRDVMIKVPSSDAPDVAKYRLEIRNFLRKEGVFSVPPGAVVTKVEARLVQDGAIKAQQEFTL
ncbi:hypothetical protein OTERR_06380 [Oryzomicrobium terrae]|uniref:Uncharacterized protein n=1 Tax=Oryzomicrobium terrae TaxID=1735038 RepID=A0A5C1E652_9RHOO|nr:hypothetical protein OTERR_06380 [Oryzomicrobium terrae]